MECFILKLKFIYYRVLKYCRAGPWWVSCGVHLLGSHFSYAHPIFNVAQ